MESFDQIRRIAILLVFGLAPSLQLGCQSSTVQDAAKPPSSSKADLPKSYPAAVARLKTLTSEILDAAAQGNPGAAHGPLHEIGHVIQAAPKLAEASNMPEDDFGAVKQAGDELFGVFDKIDGSLHGRLAEGETLDVDAMRQQVDSAMGVLESKVKFVGDAPVDVEIDSEGHHDHDGDHGAHGDDHDDDHAHGDDGHDHEDGDHDHSDDVGDDAP